MQADLLRLTIFNLSHHICFNDHFPRQTELDSRLSFLSPRADNEFWDQMEQIIVRWLPFYHRTTVLRLLNETKY